MTPVALPEDVRNPPSAYGSARSTISGAPLNTAELRKTHDYWRACNYLMLGMIYLRDNPLLKEPLKTEHLTSWLLGHWGSSPRLAFIYIHLNRLIKKYDLAMIFLTGPGQGASGVLAPVYLEGASSEIYTDKSEDEEGMRAFFKTIFLSGRDRKSLHAGDSRVNPGRRRTWVCTLACVWRGNRVLN